VRWGGDHALGDLAFHHELSSSTLTKIELQIETR
jgi:hypothetical protein